MIVGHEKFPQFARCFYDKIGQLSVDLLDLRLEGTVLDSSARNFGEKNFRGNKFRKLVFDRENCENFCLAKISHYTVSQVYHHVPHRFKIQFCYHEVNT